MEAIIFDTETTGFDEPQIIEAAWVEVRLDTQAPYLHLISEFEQRYKPSKKISLGALATHCQLPLQSASILPLDALFSFNQ